MDRPYDPVYFVNPGHHGEWCGVEYVFPYDNFPVNSVYHSNWLSTLSGLKFVFHWSQLPVYTDIVLSTDSIYAVSNDPECFLLIHNLHEARMHGINEIAEKIQLLGIPLHKCIMLTSDPNSDSELRGGIQQVWVDNYWEALCRKHHKTSTNTAMVHPWDYTLEHVDRKFLSLNRNVKIHRMQWMYAMRNEIFDITPQGHVSFHLPEWKKEDYYQHCMDNWRNHNDGIPDQNFTVMKLDPLDPVTQPWTISNSDQLTQYYQRSYFSVVTESDHHLPFVTEKTFKTIACMHPFVIIGNPQMNSILRDKGYHTFEDYFERDSVQTQRDMIELCEWINSKDMQFFQKKTEKVLDKLTDNYYNYINGSVDWNHIMGKIINATTRITT